MGPDCGTSVIGGVMLGFANRIPQGDIGIVGASGTGLQEISCLIAQAGHGISHAVGVGGRDLSDPVGALSTLAALEMLEPFLLCIIEGLLFLIAHHLKNLLIYLLVL